MIFRLVIVFCLLGPLFVSAVTNVATVNVQKVLVPHFDGWGVSLCWWANVMGGFTNREEVADLAFTQLGLNIVRYNLGGGENPARSNAMEFRARVPGFQPEPGQWDWNADANQRWMLRAALKRGANHVVAFANSPPDWMTESGSVTGSASGTNDNLREKFEAPFAEYIATIVSNLTVLDGVKFDTVTPMNEPAAHWWKLGNRQEGAHMSVPQQARMVNLLRAALDRHGSDATIVASEDNDEHNAWAAVSAYDATTLSNLSHIVTHTYNANDPQRLRQLAERTRKPLWVSEYGDGDRTGLQLAYRIRDDIVELHAQAWIYWQFADGGGWGLIANRLDGQDERFRVSRKFYTLAQFSRFIRPGCRIIDVDDEDSLAAFDPDRKQIIIVAINDQYTSRAATFKLAGVTKSGGVAKVYRTTAGENCAEISPVAVADGTFTARLPAESVTTFVIPDVTMP